MLRTESLSPARCQPPSHRPHITSDSMNNGAFMAFNYPSFKERSAFVDSGVSVVADGDTDVVFANLF